MINGVFHLLFRSAMGILGNGLAVLENGLIRGGDDSYLYSGRYTAEDSSSVFTAHVNIQYYQGEEGSIFGSKESFQLDLSGTFTKQGIKANGHVIGQPMLQMSVEGKRVEDVYASMIPSKGPDNVENASLKKSQVKHSHPKPISSERSSKSSTNRQPLEDPFNLLSEAHHRSFNTASDLHSSGKYLDALKLIFPIIEASINTLLQKLGEQPESFSGLKKKVKELGNRGVVPQHVVQANDIVQARNSILHGNYAPPDNYLYPVSLLAFQHLHCLLTECNLSI